MIRRYNQIQDRESIRPVVYGLGIYFMLGGADSYQIGVIGSLLKIVALLPVALALLDLQRFRIRFSATLTAQLMFWLLTILSLLYSVDVARSFSSVKTLTLNLALVCCLGVMESYNHRELEFMKQALLMGGWITVLLMFLFSDISVGGRLTLLLGGDSQDQNYINGYFLYAFSYHCSRMLSDKQKSHALAALFLLSVVLLTGSRGALLAFLLVFFVHVCILFANAKHKFRNMMLVALLLVLALVVFDLILAQMPESVAQRFSWDYIAEKGSTGRTKIWRFLLQHFSGDSIPRMLFGHGYGTTSRINTLNNRVAHNLYIDNLITLGIVGLLLQLIIQGTVVRILLRRRQYPLLGAYLGMIGMCLSLSLVAYKPIWNIMLMALAIDANCRAQASQACITHNEKQEESK